jgi:hypothetical protein
MLLYEKNRTDGQTLDPIYWIIYATCPLIGGVFAGTFWRMHASVLQDHAKDFEKKITVNSSFEREELTKFVELNSIVKEGPKDQK